VNWFIDVCLCFCCRIVPDQPDNVTETDDTGKEQETTAVDNSGNSERTSTHCAECRKNSVPYFTNAMRYSNVCAGV
jgi:hypothetical protein